MTEVIRAVTVLDEVATSEGSVVLFWVEELSGVARVARVSTVASAILELTCDGMPLTELITHLTDSFGAPPGDDPVEAVRAVVDALVAQGLVECRPGL